jgi:hypothetical protein
MATGLQGRRRAKKGRGSQGGKTMPKKQGVGYDPSEGNDEIIGPGMAPCHQCNLHCKGRKR